jgi:hypothetical protein
VQLNKTSAYHKASTAQKHNIKQHKYTKQNTKQTEQTVRHKETNTKEVLYWAKTLNAGKTSSSYQ